jgi:hypothetical protein
LFKSPLLVLIPAALLAQAQTQSAANDLFLVNGGKPVNDAHNCYPEHGKWVDRIDRALSTGFPVAIEQDIAGYRDPATGELIPKVAHGSRVSEAEPTLRAHFFERVRPIVEKALTGDQKQWPVIVLHFDFKDNNPELLRAVWKLLGEYESWITTAPKGDDPKRLESFAWKPLLVLTEDNQERVFFDEVPVGQGLRLFGSAHTNESAWKGMSHQQADYARAHTPPGELLTETPTNYRRWWNNGWDIIEEGGQRKAGDWTLEDQQRLEKVVAHAHRLGYWIRFYTLDGFSSDQSQGWSQGYNFGSRAAVEERWKAALATGVNMIATDQYEDFATFRLSLANPTK